MLRLLGPTRVTGIDDPRLTRPAFLAVDLIDLAPGRLLPRETLAARLRDGATPEKANNNLARFCRASAPGKRQPARRSSSTRPPVSSRDGTTLASDLSLLLAAGEPDTPAKLRFFAELYAGDFLADIADESEVTGQWIIEQPLMAARPLRQAGTGGRPACRWPGRRRCASPPGRRGTL